SASPAPLKGARGSQTQYSNSTRGSAHLLCGSYGEVRVRAFTFQKRASASREMPAGAGGMSASDALRPQERDREWWRRAWGRCIFDEEVDDGKQLHVRRAVDPDLPLALRGETPQGAAASRGQRQSKREQAAHRGERKIVVRGKRLP